MPIQGTMLVCDSGSTKSTWCKVSADERKVVKTIGYNPYFIDTANIEKSLRESLLPLLGEPSSISSIYFYGAGCSTPHNVSIVETAIRRVFPLSKVWVDHDLLAAARALLHHKPGFAAILGTGTNTALYDGKNISLNIDSLGYFLGDEGSGTHIAKKLLRDFLRKQMPPDIYKSFAAVCTLDKEAIFDHLYNKPLPNRFLASFARFASENKDHPYNVSLVTECFDDFFKHLVTRYPDYDRYTFNCIGSIASVFSDILQKKCTQYGMAMGQIIRDPIQSLVDFHLETPSV